MKNKREYIHAISNSLNLMKDFETGYTTKNDHELLISYKGDIIKVSLEQVGQGEITNDLVDKHLC